MRKQRSEGVVSELSRTHLFIIAPILMNLVGMNRSSPRKDQLMSRNRCCRRSFVTRTVGERREGRTRSTPGYVVFSYHSLSMHQQQLHDSLLVDHPWRIPYWRRTKIASFYNADGALPTRPRQRRPSIFCHACLSQPLCGGMRVCSVLHR